MRPKRMHVASSRGPYSGAQYAQPVGIAIGAVCGALTGAILGSGMGAAGTAIGGTVGVLIGALAGGLLGRSIGESSRPTTDEPFWDAYWRLAYLKEPYCVNGRVYEDFAFAYRLGFTARLDDGSRTWASTEPGLRAQWEHAESRSRIGWNEASLAANAAWSRVGYQFAEVKKDHDWSR